MTEDQIDAYAAQLANAAIVSVGEDGAPGVLLQVMLIASHQHGLDATVLALERTCADLRAELISNIKPTGMIQ